MLDADADAVITSTLRRLKGEREKQKKKLLLLFISTKSDWTLYSVTQVEEEIAKALDVLKVKVEETCM